MTASNRPSILETARSDPVGAGIVVCVVALFVLGVLHFLPPIETGGRWRWISIPDLLGFPRPVPKPLARPPAAWRAQALPTDILTVPGHPVAYWGRPGAPYGTRPTRDATKPVAVVVHFTDETPILQLVRYGHSQDASRGGASYGYHFYIDRDGRVLQGAPLSVRTNHIKPAGAVERRAAAAHLDGSNTIGVSLVGGCRSPALSPITYRCSAETVTPAQIEAGTALILTLQTQYGMDCRAVHGHGELQTDRKSFEGLTLATRLRRAC